MSVSEVTAALGAATMNTKMMLLPRPCNGHDWLLWRQHFEARAKIHQWNDDKTKLQWLVGALVGPAEIAYLHLPETSKEDYTKVCEALEERFAGADSYDVHINNLEARHRNEGETLGDFAGAVEQLAMLAWPALDPVARDDQSRRRFIMGLSNSLRVVVLRRTPKTLQEALRAAREEESLLRMTEPAKTNPSQSNISASVMNIGETAAAVMPTAEILMEKLQGFATQLGALQNQVGELRDDARRRNASPSKYEGDNGRDRNRGPRDRRFRMKCWECSDEGHRARDCPKRGPLRERRERGAASSANKQRNDKSEN